MTNRDKKGRGAKSSDQTPDFFEESTSQSDGLTIAEDLGELTAEEQKEMDIVRRAQQGDQEARDLLVLNNRGIIGKISRTFLGRGLSFEDIFNEGASGLIEAIDKFDHRVGVKFMTYATWWIRKSILQALGEQVNTVRIPAAKRHASGRVFHAEQKLRATLGRKPTHQEIADVLGVTVGKVRSLHEDIVREHMILSLDEKIRNGESRTIGDTVADTLALPLENLILEEKRNMVHKFLAELSPREQSVVTLRFGLKGGIMLNLQEIGDQVGLSRERVRQIEADALGKLKAIINGYETEERKKREKAELEKAAREAAKKAAEVDRIFAENHLRRKAEMETRRLERIKKNEEQLREKGIDPDSYFTY